MGRYEIRPVPPDWEHPREPGTYADGSPRYVPLWSRADLCADMQVREEHPGNYEQDGRRGKIDLSDYMPEIPKGTPLGYQLYETTSEGTPVSPVFPTLEELAGWCETGGMSDPGERERWLAEACAALAAHLPVADPGERRPMSPGRGTVGISGTIGIKRRSIPGQLRYLAAKLRDGEASRGGVALSLDVLADKLESDRIVKGDIA